MAYILVGLNGLTEKGEMATVSIYFDSEDESATYDKSLEQARQVAKELRLNTTSVTSPVGATPPVSAPAETEICDIQALVYRTQKNAREDGTMSVTPALVAYKPIGISQKGVVYNRYALTTIYLNTDDQIADANTWLRSLGVEKNVTDLPQFHGQGAPMRDMKITEDYEVIPPKMGKIEVRPVERVKQDGTKGTAYRFVRFVS